MIGFGNNITSSIKDVVDGYNKVMEKKDNITAVTIANHRRNKERASAATIGATFGVAQGGVFAGTYYLANKFPILKKFFPIKWVHGQIDSWIKEQIAISSKKGKILKNPIISSVLAKIILLAASGAAFGYLADLYKTYSNTRINGKISNTKQGNVGDCWLLSGLNSLSYTKEGKTAIRNSIQKNKDNSITVKFKGANKEYTITQKELHEASRAYAVDIDNNGKVRGYNKKYSTGDGDVLAFELAFGKYREDLKNGEVKETSDNPSYAYDYVKNAENSVDYGTPSQVYYLLTGKKTCEISMNEPNSTPAAKNLGILSLYSKSQLNNFMSSFASYPTEFNAAFNFKDNNIIKDSHHKTLKIKKDHIYAIKNISDKYVTIVDPHKSRKTKDISIETFKNNLASLYYTKLTTDANNSDKILQEFCHQNSINDKYMNENM